MDNKGLSLLEISIVLIICSILVAGLYSASTLINSSRLVNAINLTAQIDLTNDENLVLWLETANITREEKPNLKIKTWDDLSINGISFSNSTNPPTFNESKKFRGINSFNFNNNTMESKNILNLDEYTIFVVANPTSTGGTIYDFGFSLKPT